MRMISIFSFFTLAALTLLILGEDVIAEPWLGNRYAQNCSSCHSPSRRNVEAKDRRCTLACQGCHVNPNGGGLRNEYGVWNQQRWLRSMKSDVFGHKGTPAPLKYQKYGNMPDKFRPVAGLDDRQEKSGSGSEQIEKSKRKKKKGEKRSPQADKVDWNEMARDGAPLVVISGFDYNEKDHDKSDRQEHITVGSRTEFMARLTEDDPYRTEREQSVFAGGDFRYFYLDYDKKPSNSQVIHYDGMLAMGLDLGVRVRPVPQHAQLVFEHRYLQGPSAADEQTSPEKVFLQNNGSQVRSAYALIDDLPYATYVMYGLYRPQFGHYNPDHTTLLNNIIYANNVSNTYNSFHATSAKAVHKAITFGGSPNVPFANISMIMPTDDNFSPNPFSQEKGFAATLGGRFVTLGASFMVSYWSTKGKRGGVGDELKNNMLGFTGGMMFKDFVLNYDYTTVDREFAVGAADKGGVSTIELKYRAWREIYGVLNFASSNVARNLKQGSATEMMYGAKMFLYPGSELEILLIDREDKDDDPNGGTGSTDTSALQAQLHLYF